MLAGFASLGIQASAPSNLNFRVEPLQFSAGLLDGKLPVDGSLLDVCSGGPGSDFRLQSHDVGDAAIGQALVVQAAQFAFRHIEPTTVLGCVDEMDPPHVFACFLGRECFVERSLRMRVLEVADTVPPLLGDIDRRLFSTLNSLAEFRDAPGHATFVRA